MPHTASAQSQLSPTGSTPTRTPTFTWTASTTAQYYSLWVDDSHDEGTIDWSIISPAAAGCPDGTGVCSVSPGIVLAPGPAYWQLGVRTSKAHSWVGERMFIVPSTTDMIAPTLTITGPTSAATYATSNAALLVNGTATDNIGIAQVSWTNDRGGSGTALGTANWSINLTLQPGPNAIAVTARDAANNKSVATVTVVYNAPPDTTKPMVAITGPTPDAAYTTSSSTLTLSGSASDNVGVTSVNWISDRGFSGTASGTTSWSAALTLAAGVNLVTVSARDGSGNVAIDTLTINYVKPTVCPYPSGKIDTATPTFCWNAVKNAQYYSLWVDDSREEGRIDLEVISPAAAGCPDGTGLCSVSPGVALGFGQAYWQLGIKTLKHSWGSPTSFWVVDPNAPCLSLNPGDQRHPADPQTGFIVVTTNGCAWTATATAPWIVITPGWTNGVGDGRVRYDLLPNATGALREADIVIGPRRYHVTQLANTTCGGVLSGYRDLYDANAHVETVSLSLGTSCSWTARSNVSWVTLRADSRNGTGSATIRWDVAPNPSAIGRSGTLTIAGRTYSVEQHGTSTNESCPAIVTPLATTVSREGGSHELSVSVAAGCVWNATSLSPFINITSVTGGNGSGTVTYFVDDNPSPEARTGFLDVGSRTVQITQSGAVESPCTYTISGTDPIAAGPATVSLELTTAAGCSWTASSAADFLDIAEGASGSGSGTIRITARENPAHEARLGELTIAAQSVGVMQLGAGGEPTCVTSVTPGVISSAAIGVAGVVTVTAPPDCAWSAVSDVGWLVLSEKGAARFGSGTFAYEIALNSSSARAATIHIGSSEVAISQDGATPTGVDSSEILWPAPEPKKANDCFGNCGGGCGTFLAVCGTNGGNWTSEVLSTLQHTDDALIDICVGDKLQTGVFPRYGATVRWTYHGVESHPVSRTTTCAVRGSDSVRFLVLSSAVSPFSVPTPTRSARAPGPGRGATRSPRSAGPVFLSRLSKIPTRRNAFSRHRDPAPLRASGVEWRPR